MNYHQIMLENQSIYTKHFFEKIQDLKLSHGQPKILEYLLEHEGCMQKDIARACMIEPPTVTSLLSKMEKDHLIMRKSLDGNRRSLHIFLTDEGNKKAKIVKDTFIKIDEDILSILSDKEKNQLLNLLKKVNNRLREF